MKSCPCGPADGADSQDSYWVVKEQVRQRGHSRKLMSRSQPGPDGTA